MADEVKSTSLVTAQEIAAADEPSFYSSLIQEDMLGVVVRGAIHIENQLNCIIEENLPAPRELKDMRLTYGDRICLAAALGMRADLRPPLKCFGKIRNDFAHKLDTVVGADEANRLYKAFAPDDKEKIQQIYDRTNTKLGHPRPAKFSMSDPKDRLTFCIIVLRGALISVRAQARHARVPA